jgi:hypothetical protein
VAERPLQCASGLMKIGGYCDGRKHGAGGIGLWVFDFGLIRHVNGALDVGGQRYINICTLYGGQIQGVGLRIFLGRIPGGGPPDVLAAGRVPEGRGENRPAFSTLGRREPRSRAVPRGLPTINTLAGAADGAAVG